MHTPLALLFSLAAIVPSVQGGIFPCPMTPLCCKDADGPHFCARAFATTPGVFACNVIWAKNKYAYCCIGSKADDKAGYTNGTIDCAYMGT